MSTTLTAPEIIEQPALDYRTIDRYPGYRFGADGSVWSAWLQRRGGSILGEYRKLKTRCAKSTRWYHIVTLKTENGYPPVLVHRLILEAFGGPCPDGCEARHFPSGDKSDNRACNLVWGTRKQNIIDKWPQGKMPHGESHHQSKLTRENVLEMRKSHTGGESVLSLARRFGVHEKTARSAIYGRTWAWIP